METRALISFPSLACFPMPMAAGWPDISRKQAIATRLILLSGPYNPGPPSRSRSIPTTVAESNTTGCKMDAFLRSGANDIYSSGYFKQTTSVLRRVSPQPQHATAISRRSLARPSQSDFLAAAANDRLITGSPQHPPNLGLARRPQVSAPLLLAHIFHSLGPLGQSIPGISRPYTISLLVRFHRNAACVSFIDPSTPFSTTHRHTIIRTRHAQVIASSTTHSSRGQ